MNTNDMRDNIMGRIAIALFGEHNNRTDEECVIEIVRLRAERDEARALNSAMIAMLPSTYYMDPPDGGSVMPEEQMRRMSQDAARYRWLRSDAPPESSRWPRWSLEHWSGAAWCPMRGAELDAAIDAALKDAK